jgi:hypothetical protein
VVRNHKSKVVDKYLTNQLIQVVPTTRSEWWMVQPSKIGGHISHSEYKPRELEKEKRKKESEIDKVS